MILLWLTNKGKSGWWPNSRKSAPLPWNNWNNPPLHCCCSVALSQSRDSATPWTAAHQASLSYTISQSLLKIVSIEPVMPSNYLILCHSLLLLPSIFPNIRVFSNESALCNRWPKYWSFSFVSFPSISLWVYPAHKNQIIFWGLLMAHTLRSVFLSKLNHFLPITLSLTEFFLQRDIKNQGFIKSWHQVCDLREKRVALDWVWFPHWSSSPICSAHLHPELLALSITWAHIIWQINPGRITT